MNDTTNTIQKQQKVYILSNILDLLNLWSYSNY